jgi:hypothetical protein
MTGLTDEWLRTQFEDHARTIDTPTDLHSETLQRARVTRRRRKGIQATLALGLAAVVTGIVVIVAAGPSPSTTPVPADQPPAPPFGPAVETTWGYAYLSDPVTFDDIAQNLRSHGLNEWVEPLHDQWGDVDGTIQLDFDNGNLTASIPGTGVSRTNDYLVSTSHLYLWGDADSELKATARELDAGGQRLTLTLKESAAPPSDGIPGEVYERALYTTVPFNEIPPPTVAELSPGTYQSGSVRFGRIARSLRVMNLDSSVEQLRKMWGNADAPVQVRLELNGETATTSIPGTQISFTGPYTRDGSLIRFEDGDPGDDDGWIELYRTPSPDPDFGFYFWDAGPAAWEGLPAEAIVEALFLSEGFGPTEE